MMIKESYELQNTLKSRLLNHLALIHSKALKNDLRYYLSVWKERCRKDMLKKRAINLFFNIIFRLKLLAFKKLKLTCNQNEMFKFNGANSLQRVLLTLHRKVLQEGFYPMKESWKHYHNIRARTLRKIAGNSESNLKQAYYQWANTTRNLRHIATCKKLINFITSTNEVFKNQLLIVMDINNTLKKKREKSMMFLISSFNNKLRQCFNKWRDSTQRAADTETWTNEKKRTLLINLEKMSSRLEDDQLREAFLKLKRIIADSRLKKRCLLAMLKTQFGRMQDAFDRWKNLPKPEDPSRKAGVGALMYQLNKIYFLALKRGYGPIKNNWNQKNEIRENCMRRLVVITQGQLKDAFNEWKNNAQTLQHILICKRLLNLFDTLNFKLRVDVAMIVQSDKKKEKMIKLFTKMNQNLCLLLRDAFFRWKDKMNGLKMNEKITGDGKLTATTMITEWVNDRKLKLYREVLSHFISHGKKRKILKTLFLDLFKTRTGQLHQAFEKWKSIPAPSDSLAKAQGQGLVQMMKRLVDRRMRLAFDSLKEEWVGMSEFKKKVIKKLIWMGERKLQQSFEKWAAFSKSIEKIRAVRAVQQIFELMRVHLKTELTQFAGNIVISDRKKGALQLVARTFLARSLGHFFQKWYLVTKISEVQAKQKIPNLLGLILKNHNAVLKQAFELLRTRNTRLHIKKFAGIFEKWILSVKKEAFEAIHRRAQLQKQHAKILVVNKMLRFMKMYQQARLYSGFTLWRNNALNYNPWFKRSMEVIAKTAHISYQIAFWRLRDSITVDGMHIEPKRITALKKLIQYVKKRYETTISRAFCQIQSGILSKSLIQQGGTEAHSEDDLQRVEKQKMFVLRLIVKNHLLSAFEPADRLKYALEKWRLRVESMRSSIVQLSLKKKMNKRELEYLAKLGSLELIHARIESIANKFKREAFYSIANVLGFRLKEGQSRDASVTNSPLKMHLGLEFESK